MIKAQRSLKWCTECELAGNCKPVKGGCQTEARVAIVAECSKLGDLEQGIPFTSGMGKVARAMVSRAGFNNKAIWWTSITQCVPVEGLSAGRCIESFHEELGMMAKAGVKVILACGQAVADWFKIDGNILKIRGSVYKYENFYVIPTFEASFFMAGNQEHEPTWCADIEKAFRIAADGWEPPVENFGMFPTIIQLEELFHLEDGDKPAMLSCDLETTSLNPEAAKIIVMGVAFDAERAISIPFMTQGGGVYWHALEKKQRILKLVQYILDNYTLLWQNGAYDLSVLECRGFNVWKNLAHDTMLMHHAFHPELPHDLGYIGSIYADTPYWKGAVLGDESKMIDLPDEQLRRYNLRDCVVLHQIYPLLKADLEANGTWDIYNNISRRLIKPTVKLKLNGMKIYENRLPKWIAGIDMALAEQRSQFVERTQVPSLFNVASAYHARKLFYGITPPGHLLKKSELESYNQIETKKKKETKKYRELFNAVSIIEEIKPLARLPGGFAHTKSGQADLSTKTLNKMRMRAIAEIEKLGKYRRPTDEHRRLIGEYQNLIAVISLFLEYKKWAKLKSTYTKFATGSDGRIHPSYKIHGTRTGRLSSSGPNWQNLPKSVKMLFGPSQGNVIVQGDYSNIELRVLSYESDDEVLQATFASGAKVHNENVKVLFGLSAESSSFDAAKRAAKTYTFGRGYGGGLRGIYERVSMQVPELGLTWEKFVEADRNYRQAHPKYMLWVDKMLEQAVETRQCATAFGRKRIFLGTDDAVSREILNTPIQGAAADVFNVALIRMQEWIDQNPSYKTMLIGAVHDSIVVECPRDKGLEVANVLKNIMETPNLLWGKQILFPVELEICEKSWAEHITLEEFANGTIKHARDQRTASETDSEWYEEIEEEESRASE